MVRPLRRRAYGRWVDQDPAHERMRLLLGHQQWDWSQRSKLVLQRVFVIRLSLMVQLSCFFSLTHAPTMWYSLLRSLPDVGVMLTGLSSHHNCEPSKSLFFLHYSASNICCNDAKWAKTPAYILIMEHLCHQGKVFSVFFLCVLWPQNAWNKFPSQPLADVVVLR
jgi:hypothetical protein